MKRGADTIGVGTRVLIVTGPFAGQEGVCLGSPNNDNFWPVSPDSSNEILLLEFEKDFSLLVDLSSPPELN